MALLVQFLFRLTFGMALAMAITDPREVSSGYYRNNLYVLLGLMVLAALAVGRVAAEPTLLLSLSITAALVSYFSAVAWLYEQPRWGIRTLWLVAGLALAGAWLTPATAAPSPPSQVATLSAGVGEVSTDRAPESASMEPPLSATIARRFDAVAGGLLLGTTMAAMLLGHWYLNAPGMRLEPLFRLLVAMSASIGLRIAVSAVGLAFTLQMAPPASRSFWSFLALRWLAGMVGVAVLVGMTWQTLKIPNTQSATGILYVAVIATLLGELTGMLLSAGQPFPL